MFCCGMGVQVENNTAAAFIQRYVRARKARRLWLAAIDNLRSKFIDEEAKRAGAETNKFYSAMVLLPYHIDRIAAAYTTGGMSLWVYIATHLPPLVGPHCSRCTQDV